MEKTIEVDSCYRPQVQVTLVGANWTAFDYDSHENKGVTIKIKKAKL